MRHVISAFAIAIAAGAFVAPVVHAQDNNDTPSSPQQPKQYQSVKPEPDSANGGAVSGDSTTRRDQSAQAPKSHAVISPPSTGDKSVIVPPKDGASKTPVIAPPGTPGDNNNVEPK
jgi:hypothetical protein